MTIMRHSLKCSSLFFFIYAQVPLLSDASTNRHMLLAQTQIRPITEDRCQAEMVIHGNILQCRTERKANRKCTAEPTLADAACRVPSRGLRSHSSVYLVDWGLRPASLPVPSKFEFYTV